MLQLADHLWENHSISQDEAAEICVKYLKAFRKCPDNPSVPLDEWRHLLWEQALSEGYSHLADEMYLQWLQLRYHYLAMTPEIKAMLRGLRQHYLLGLITNGPSCAQWEKVQRLGLESYFDVVLVSGDLPWEKPDRAIFQQACRFLGVEPRNCAMVGDKLETDILGGIEAGLGATVWVPLADDDGGGGADIEEAPRPDYTIRSVTELPRLLPRKQKVPHYRSNSTGMLPNLSQLRCRKLSMPDLDDCSSNSSDGS